VRRLRGGEKGSCNILGNALDVRGGQPQYMEIQGGIAWYATEADSGGERLERPLILRQGGHHSGGAGVASSSTNAKGTYIGIRYLTIEHPQMGVQKAVALPTHP
jgi:hypothetical protein